MCLVVCVCQLNRMILIAHCSLVCSLSFVAWHDFFIPFQFGDRYKLFPKMLPVPLFMFFFREKKKHFPQKAGHLSLDKIIKRNVVWTLFHVKRYFPNGKLLTYFHGYLIRKGQTNKKRTISQKVFFSIKFWINMALHQMLPLQFHKEKIWEIEIGT